MNRRVVAVFGSSRLAPESRTYREAVDLGASLASVGATVATGGYGGAMEAVSRGAHEAGGQVIGVTAPSTFPDRIGHNAYVTSEIRAETISQRIHKLVDIADAYIALPGSLGTATEVLVAWNEIYVAPMARRTPKPLILVGDAWANLINGLVNSVDADDTGITLAANPAAAAEIMCALLGQQIPRDGSSE